MIQTDHADLLRRGKLLTCQGAVHTLTTKPDFSEGRKEMEVHKGVLSALYPLVLCACGGSNSTSTENDILAAAQIPESEQAARTFADNGDSIEDLGAAIAGGAVLTSRSATTAGIDLGYDQSDQETEIVPTIIAVSEVTANSIKVSVDGVERVFGVGEEFLLEGEVVGYTYDGDDGEFYNIFNLSGPVSEIGTTGNGWSAILLATSSPPGADRARRAFAVIGTETTDDAIPSLTGTATYTGEGFINLFPAEGFVNIGQSRTSILGDVTMNANFDNGGISGEMTSLSMRSPGEEEADIDGRFIFEEALFSENNFEGAFAVDGDAAAETGLRIDEGSTYNGAFFGPNAENVGATTTFTGTMNGEAVNGIGVFAD